MEDTFIVIYEDRGYRYRKMVFALSREDALLKLDLSPTCKVINVL